MGITNETQMSGYPSLIYTNARKHAILEMDPTGKQAL